MYCNYPLNPQVIPLWNIDYLIFPLQEAEADGRKTEVRLLLAIPSLDKVLVTMLAAGATGGPGDSLVCIIELSLCNCHMDMPPPPSPLL